MPKNVNSASRIVALLRRIPSHRDDTQTLEVWAKLFGINEENPNKKSAAVAELLAAVYRELELVRVQMREANFSEELYSGAVSKVEQALSTMLLPSAWSQPRQYLTPETLGAIAFCSEILPDEESLIAPDELAAISAQVDELESSLADSNLPPRLRALVKHHIEMIRRALAEYPISGVKVLREATQTAFGEIVEVRETIKANRGAPEIKKLDDVWKRVNQAADAAIKAGKVVELGQKAWDLLQNFMK
jgi:hypothetical protein